MTRPRAGFDARTLTFPAGGVRRYVRELYARLPAIAPDIDFVAVDPPSRLQLPAGTTAGAAATGLPTNLARAAVTLPAAVRRSRLDLFHAPAYTAPLRGYTPVVLTIHDVSYARRPEFYAHRSGRLRQWFYRRSAMLAARIITDSEFSRGEIVAAYRIPASRIALVPLGVDSRFQPRSSQPTALGPDAGAMESADRCAGRRVRPPYALHVGDLHPRRDAASALRAIIRVRSRATVPAASRLQFVCAGQDGGTAADLRAQCASSGDSNALVLLGPVPEEELVALYQDAVALVYPSRYEGFGLPVLEAMACGVPVVAARAGAIPEVLGDAGVLVPCGDSDAIADAIELMLADHDRRSDLRARGIARAASFSWDRTAQETLNVYRECLHRGPAAESRRR
jgi:glycosyltransferase involved in cell wall biosynthesis